MNSAMLSLLANHLWQSTLFAGAVWVLTLILRKNSARIRYSLWLAASIKFLIPVSLLTALGAEMSQSIGFERGTQASVISMAAEQAAQIGRLTSIGGEASMPLVQVADQARSAGFNKLFIALAILWAIGALAVAERWFSRWLQIRTALGQSKACDLAFVVPVRLSTSQLEPGVIGIVRPVLLLPEGIDQRLTPQQMSAVLAHERCHLAWRDNLSGALHMLVEALFWFHPLIWWIGKKLVDERERACDEHVIASGHARESYIEGILNVCEQYLKLQLPCVSGMSGATLKQRMEDIMQMQLIERLSGVRKVLLSAVAAIAIAAPIAVGVLTAPSVSAQAEPSISAQESQGLPQGLKIPFYRNVSIQRVDIERAGTGKILFYPEALDIENMSLRDVIAALHAVNRTQVVGRDWNSEPLYNITAEGPIPSAAPPRPGVDVSLQNQQMYGTALYGLLTTHFGMVTRLEKRQMDGYALQLGKGDSKPANSAIDPRQRSIVVSSSGYSFNSQPLSQVSYVLTRLLGIPVVDQTELVGNFDFEFKWDGAPDARPDPVAVAKALEQQLGLKLVAKPVPATIINVVNLKPSSEVVTTPAATSLTIQGVKEAIKALMKGDKA
ncbi:MAG: M56 family metallopeptidase [Steroidobacteraceae bacterium]